jgi:purine-cytosine permease-like protein
MESQVMQLPLYVKITALIGAALVIFVLAAWEVVNEWLASAARAIVRGVKSKPAHKKPA